MKIPDIQTCLQKLNIPFLKTDGGWHKVTCPFHSDTPNLPDAKGGVSPDGQVFKCFVCGEFPVTGFLAGATGKTPAVITAYLSNVFADKLSEVDDDTLDNWTTLLLRSEEKLAVIKSKGINEATIRKFRIGLQAKGFITIPIFDSANQLVNLRRYSPETKPKYRSVSGTKQDCIYNSPALSADTVIITEGELKVAALDQRGFAAVCSTAGAGKWDRNWNHLFENKDVIVIFDVDDAGRKGALKLCRSLFPHVKSLKNVFLEDVTDIEGGDISDYFGKKRRSGDDLRRLIDRTELYTPPTAPGMDDSADNELIELQLSETSNAKYFNMNVETEVVVSAKDTHPYIIPSKIEVKCPRGGHEVCMVCPVAANPEKNGMLEISKSSPKILEMIGVGHEAQKNAIKRMIGIPAACKFCAFKSHESFNVEELRCIPQIAIGHNTAECVVRRVFSIGHGMTTNAPYKIRARSTVDPTSQYSTLLAYEAEPGIDDIDSFKLSMDLRVFQPYDWSKRGIEARLADIYDDLVCNVTKIYDRDDMHLFIDLVFHSALYIPFQGKLIKGWVDALIIGDSGQGKSEASSSLRKHYGAGERVDTKQASVAGILGGVQESNKRWFVTWGTIPLNDRRMVILEEVKGMPAEAFGKLTDMRSSGVAEIVKIERARTNARTRLLWITNPRSGRPMGTYNYGVDAIKELVGSLEDIRRYDMAMAVASGEVGIELINAKSADRRSCPVSFSSDLCNHLIMWGWSRTEKDIVVPPETESAILDCATRMGRSYSANCPLVEPSDQRLKILRLSTALAIRTFSTEDGNSVIVRPGHVQVIEDFLNRIYYSTSLGYKEYSMAEMGESYITDTDEIELEFRTIPNGKDLVNAFLVTDNLTWQDVADFTEFDRDNAQKVISLLARNNALKRQRRGGYRKTQSFIELLKKLDRIPQTEFRKEASGTFKGL